MDLADSPAQTHILMADLCSTLHSMEIPQRRIKVVKNSIAILIAEAHNRDDLCDLLVIVGMTQTGRFLDQGHPRDRCCPWTPSGKDHHAHVLTIAKKRNIKGRTSYRCFICVFSATFRNLVFFCPPKQKFSCASPAALWCNFLPTSFKGSKQDQLGIVEH